MPGGTLSRASHLAGRKQVNRILMIGGCVLLLTAALLAETVHLKGGDVVSGRIVRESSEVVVLETPYGVLEFPRGRIARIERAVPVKVRLKNGNILSGRLTAEDKDTVELETPYGTLRIPRSDLAGIERTGGAGHKLKVLWKFKTKSPSYGSAATADIDGDGKLEIVFGTYFNDSHLYALNAEDGSLLWKAKSGGGPIDASVAIADMTGDGKLEVIFADSANGLISCLRGKDGSALWTHKSQSGTDSPPAVADVDGDGKPELIYGTMWMRGQGGWLNVLNGEDGTKVWDFQIEKGCIQSEPVIIDLDGDGTLDVIFTVWRGDDCVYALNGRTGKLIWKLKTGGSMYHGVAAGDLDNDGKAEIVTCSTDGSLYVLDAMTGQVKWKKKFTRHWAFAPVSLGDLDGDGKMEIVVAVRGIWVFRHDGKEIWKKDLSCTVARGAALADLDGDGKMEIVFGTGDRNLRVWRGTDGAELASFDATCGKHQYERIDHAPVIADFDGDGASDIFFVAGKGTSDKSRPENYGCAYVLTFGKGKGEWKTFRHDNRRSGCAAGLSRKK